MVHYLYCDIDTHIREIYRYARIGYTIFNHFWQQSKRYKAFEERQVTIFDPSIYKELDRM